LEKETAERQLSLTDEHMHLLERFSPEFRERHIEAPHPGALVAVNTFFVGVLKGVGKVYSLMFPVKAEGMMVRSARESRAVCRG
ncbi:MAG: hypothetical protein JO262_03450, partial [Solirubrobacterales bacterium]|nr:hypothetical protein [Solirubrobacterales bacterium]